MTANTQNFDSQLSAKEAAKKEKLIRELLAMGVDLGQEVKAIAERDLQSEKDGFLAAIIGLEGFQSMFAKRELQAITIKYIPEMEYVGDDNNPATHPAKFEIQYHEKANITKLPAQRTPGNRGEVAIQYRISDDSGKAIAEWSGRAMIPKAFLDHIRKDSRVKLWEDDKIRESFSTGYKEKGWSEEDHKLIHEIMNKFKV